jgi:ABC-type transporter Mla subunit MlaD
MRDIIFPITYKSDEKGLKVAESQLSGFGTIGAGIFASLGASAVRAFADATRAVADFTIDSVKAASSFNETSAAVEQVFGDSAKQLEDFSKTASNTMGQSRTQFLGAAKNFGIFGKAAGLADDANADFSQNLAILATDLASFNNTSVDEAITAIGAGLRGENEPLRRFGVLLDDATLKARAMEMGIYDGNGSLTAQQKVLAANAEIFAQTSTQQGDFARTSEGVANASKTLTAEFEDMQTVVGQALLPALEDVIPFLSTFIDNLVSSPEFKTFIDDLATGFTDMLPNLELVVTNFGQFAFNVLPDINELLPIFNDSLSILNTLLEGTATEGKDAWGWIGDLGYVMKNLATATETVSNWIDDLNLNMEQSSKFTYNWSTFIDSAAAALSPLTKGLENIANLIRWITGTKVYVPGMSTNIDVARGRLTGQATGGETTRSGLSWVGERGPELLNLPTGAQVIPLGKIPSGGGGGATFNISINAGMGADGAALGEQIVTAIRKYERTSGRVFAAA